MVVVLKKGASKEEIAKIDKKLFGKKAKGFDSSKHNGVLKIKGDALEIQKKLRDGWERDLG